MNNNMKISKIFLDEFVFTFVSFSILIVVWFVGLLVILNGISTLVGYLTPNLFV